MPDDTLVGVVIEDPRWLDVGIEDLAQRAAAATLRAVGRDPDTAEIALLACDDYRIAVLNASFRGKPVPTNVLSWPAFDGEIPEESPDEGEPLFLGDLALAFDTCTREAQEGHLTLADHTTHLVVHGVLHLLGHDHVEDAQAEVMEAIETNVLASLGIANPYSLEERPLGAVSGLE